MQRHEDSGFSSIPSRKKTQETFFDFATTLPVDKPATIRIHPKTDRTNSCLNSEEKSRSIRYAVGHGRDTGQIRSTGKPEAFKHGLAGISQRRTNGSLTPTTSRFERTS